jgi:uncharacterized protein
VNGDTDFRVLELDPDTSLLFLTGNHRAFLVSRALGDRFGADGLNLTDAERREWARLQELGLVSDENAAVLRQSGHQDGADLAINVNLTNICNLACTYCFADGGDYGRIKDAMGLDSVEHIFAFIEQHVTRSRSVRFEFFGGEPLANFPIIDEICRRSEAFGPEHGVSFVYRISTNLTLLPDAAPALFARHRFIVSVSIDGGSQVQDANRPAKGGQGSYRRVIRNAGTVRATSDDITMVARMTVAQREPSLIDNMKELWELNLFDYFQIYPGVFPQDSGHDAPPAGGDRQVVFLQTPTFPGQQGGSGSSCAPAPSSTRRYINFMLQEGMVEQFRQFLREYPALFRPDNRFRGVLEYERTVQYVLEGRLALSFCSGGRTYFTHSPDGSISPCHRLVGDQSFDVGAGDQGLIVEPQAWRRTVDDHPVCGRCWARYVCGGGCKQENFVASGDLNVLNLESCGYQLLLTEEVLRMMARSSPEYRGMDRKSLDDLFVSCGRPTLPSGRAEPAGLESEHFEHFQPLMPIPDVTPQGARQ